MLTVARLVAVLLASAWAAPAAYECVYSWPDGRPAAALAQPAPVRVTGPVCGTVVLEGSEDVDMSDGSLRLTGPDHQLVALAPISHGEFTFPVVPPGVYRIAWLPGFGSTTEIEVRRGKDVGCTTPLKVRMRVGDECDWYSRVSRGRRKPSP